MEPPAICATTEECPKEGYEYVIPSVDIVNGKWSHDFDLATVNGAWYAHVTVSPTGFECAMTIVDACTEVDVNAPCTAVVSETSVINYINKFPSDPSEGVLNIMPFSVDHLYNCNLCANINTSSPDDPAVEPINNSISWSELIHFMKYGTDGWHFTS